MTGRLLGAALRLVPANWRESVRQDLTEENSAGGLRRVGAALQAAGIGLQLHWVIASNALSSDFRYALRSLLHARAFAIGAVLTFALGIGVNMGVFVVVDRVLFRPMPFPQPNELVTVFPYNPKTGQTYFMFPKAAAVEARRMGGAFMDVAYVGNSAPYYLQGPDAPPLLLTRSSFNSLDVLGVQVIAGRSFNREDVLARTRVALLREEVWRNRFGADPSVIGRRFLDRDGAVEVRGVLPSGFLTPSVNWVSARDGLMLELDTFDTASPRDGVPGIFGRLRPGASIREAQQQFDAVIAATEADRAADRRSTVIVRPMQEGLFWNYGVPLELLFWCGSLVWLIACANLGTLMIARGRSREPEAAIRRSLGASTSRIVSSALLETALVCAAGALLALLVLSVTLPALTSIIPVALKPLVLTSVDVRVFVFALVAGLLGATVAALFPVWRTVRADPQAALQAGVSRHITRLRGGRGLLIAESGIGTVLVLAGFFAVRSFVGLVTTDLGYVADGLYSVSVGVGSSDQTPEARFALRRQALETLRLQPGIDAVTGVDVSIGSGESVASVADAEGRRVFPRRIIEDYFDVMRTTFLAGRMFTDAEIRAEAPVAILSRSAVQLLLPDVAIAQAVGRTVELHDEPVRQIVGVVSDTRERQGSEIQPELFSPASPHSNSSLSFLARRLPDRVLDQAQIQEAIRREFGATTRVRVSAVSVGLDSWLENPKFYGRLFGSFAFVGLLLSIVGLFAVTSFEVSFRQHEIGVRMALGASRGNIERAIVADAIRPVVFGIVLGGLIAYWAAQYLQTLLYQVDARDLSSYVVVTLALIVAASMAAWRPARRAARIDPWKILRR